jgi:peptidylprolyl isomerase domain and WD repeat-containing protein 1
MNILEDKLYRFIGESESLRFLNITLYQGAPKKKTVVTLEMATSDNAVYKESEATDPTLYCTAYKKNRFYCFSQRSPEESDDASHRDIFNEKPIKEESAQVQNPVIEAPGNNVTLHTTFGDIHIRLFPEYAPKAVENFIGLAKKGYFERCSWHRIMKGFSTIVQLI